VYEQRQRQLNSTCSRPTSERHMPAWERLYVSNQRRYVYCSIPKVACSSWMHTVLRLEGKNISRVSKVHDPQMTDGIIKRAVHYKPAERDALLSNYFKFMFVRDPLERLVSAYRDKCYRDPSYRWLPQAIKQRRRALNSTRNGKSVLVSDVVDISSTNRRSK